MNKYEEILWLRKSYQFANPNTEKPRGVFINTLGIGKFLDWLGVVY